MKKAFIVFYALVAAGLFVLLVYGVLRVAYVAEPASATVHGPTVRRLWATTVVVIGLGSAIVGVLALLRPGGRCGVPVVRWSATAAGTVAAVNGVWVLAMAQGGPGSGNGVVGGAAALVLGITAMLLSGAAHARARRVAIENNSPRIL